MSEWKWCGDCGHHYKDHDEEKGKFVFGGCQVEGCACTQMYFVDTP